MGGHAGAKNHSCKWLQRCRGGGGCSAQYGMDTKIRYSLVESRPGPGNALGLASFCLGAPAVVFLTSCNCALEGKLPPRHQWGEETEQATSGQAVSALH